MNPWGLGPLSGAYRPSNRGLLSLKSAVLGLFALLWAKVGCSIAAIVHRSNLVPGYMGLAIHGSPWVLESRIVTK